MTETGNTDQPSPAPEETAPKETDVEIHKPKPVHNWREFLTELGTIVLGICIAIGLEQLVENWRWQHEVEIGHQAIMAEMAANNGNLLAFRVAIAPCVDRQIREADAVLTVLEAGGKSGGLASFRMPPFTLIRDSEWQSERASQVLTHFPRAQLAPMGRYYAQLQDFRDWGSTETAAWRELNILQHPPAGIMTSDLIRLRVNLTNARDVEYLIVLNAKRQLRLSQQLGVRDSDPDPVRTKNFCAMSVDEYRRYRSSQDLR
jgi:hypothetical protein